MSLISSMKPYSSLMKSLNIFLALFLVLIFSISCRKSEFRETVDEVILSLQDTQSEEVMADVDLLVDEGLTLPTDQHKDASIYYSIYLNGCPSVSLDSVSSPQVMVLDFGTSCTGKDGKIRSGKIIVTSDSFRASPSVRTKSFDNYFVNKLKIEGKVVKTIQNDFVNRMRTATISEDITISTSDNLGVSRRSANLTRQYEMNDLGVLNDNMFKCWGVLQFKRASGVAVTKVITVNAPVVYSAFCHHIVSGTVAFTTSTNHNWSINFGNGECDDKAILTVGNKSKEITIR